MELYEAMRSTPAMRSFKPDPVPRDVLRRVLDNARFAPSGGNRQGWRVVAVESPEGRRRLRELYVPHWEAYTQATGARALLDAPAPVEGVSARRLQMLRNADDFAHHLDDVPLHLVVCAELAALALVDRVLDRPSIVGGASIYPFVQNILLGSRAEGLGTSLTTIITAAEEDVRTLLGLPRGIAVAALVAVGSPAAPWPTKLSRRPLEEFAFAERWGESL
ncbi:MAG: nitroreductase family protein [Solirubrobacteraceae bacterium]|nr:MAG: oxidoreductase [Solirubrobacterales bacterium]